MDFGGQTASRASQGLIGRSEGLPPTKARINRLPLAIPLGQVRPRGPGAKNPQNAIEQPTIVEARSPHVLFGKQVLDQAPPRVGEFVAAHRKTEVGSRKRVQQSLRYSIQDFPNRA